MAKKKAAKSAKPAKENKEVKVEKTDAHKKEQNYKVIIGLLLIGIGVLLYLLFQGQQTIAEQRATMAQQQDQIKTLEAKVEELESSRPLENLLEGAGERLLERGTEIIEEIISPEEINL